MFFSSTSSQNQFASLMEVWAKGAVEKILMMLKVSVCEAEDSPATEQRAGLGPKTKQTRTKAGQVAGPKKSKPEIFMFFHWHFSVH